MRYFMLFVFLLLMTRWQNSYTMPQLGIARGRSAGSGKSGTLDWFWVNSDICSVSYTWVMIAVSNSWNCSATRSAVCWTSWWFRCCDVMPAARLVIQEMPQTSIPMWRAAIVSQAVLMPTASATGAVHTDFCRGLIRWTGKLKVYTFFQRNAEFLGFFLYDLLHPFTIGFTHIRKTGSKFFNIGTDQWIGIPLIIWSVMSMRSPDGIRY